MGLIQEMVDDTFESIDPDMDDEVDAEVDKVVLEVTNLDLDKIGEMKGKKLAKKEEAEEEEESDEKEKQELEDMKNRLKALS